eukprot:gene9153-biopygen18186
MLLAREYKPSTCCPMDAGGTPPLCCWPGSTSQALLAPWMPAGPRPCAPGPGIQAMHFGPQGCRRDLLLCSWPRSTSQALSTPWMPAGPRPCAPGPAVGQGGPAVGQALLAPWMPAEPRSYAPGPGVQAKHFLPHGCRRDPAPMLLAREHKLERENNHTASQHNCSKAQSNIRQSSIPS